MYLTALLPCPGSTDIYLTPTVNSRFCPQMFNCNNNLCLKNKANTMAVDLSAYPPGHLAHEIILIGIMGVSYSGKTTQCDLMMGHERLGPMTHCFNLRCLAMNAVEGNYGE